MKIGIGYDSHRLVEDRKLIIGGVEIPFEKGLAALPVIQMLTYSAMQ
jgi:2-C-methyl-D-erythritol 2,4-cyclodiphosphate synthase